MSIFNVGQDHHVSTPCALTPCCAGDTTSFEGETEDTIWDFPRAFTYPANSDEPPLLDLRRFRSDNAQSSAESGAKNSRAQLLSLPVLPPLPEASSGASMAASFRGAFEIMQGDYCKIKAKEDVLQQHRSEWHTLVDFWLQQVSQVLDTMDGSAQADVSLEGGAHPLPNLRSKWARERDKSILSHFPHSLHVTSTACDFSPRNSCESLDSLESRPEISRMPGDYANGNGQTDDKSAPQTLATSPRLEDKTNKKKKSVAWALPPERALSPEREGSRSSLQSSTSVWTSSTNSSSVCSAPHRSLPFAPMKKLTPSLANGLRSGPLEDLGTGLSNRTISSKSSRSSLAYCNRRHQSVMSVMSENLHPHPSGLRRPLHSIISSRSSTAQLAGKKASIAAHLAASTGKKRLSALSWREKLRLMVDHPCFDICSCMLILSSTAVNAAEVEAEAVRGPEAVGDFPFGTITNVFAFCFLMEVILKLTALQLEFFYGEDWSWNLFDLALVVVGCVEVCVALLSQDGSFIDTAAQRTLRAVRVVRNLRIIRALRFFYELRQMLLAVFGSMRTLMWLGVLLSMLLYFFALCFTSAVTDYLTEEANRNVADREILKKEYGSLLATFLSLFKAITNGVSWGQVMEPLRRIGGVYVALYLGYILFAVFAFTNVVTSVFVDSAMRASQSQQDQRIGKELEKKQQLVRDLEAIFYEVDIDGSGFISSDELEFWFADERCQAYFFALGLDNSDAKKLFSFFDNDGSGNVDVDEFVRGCLRLKGEATSLQQHELKQSTDRILRRLTRFMTYVHGEFQRLGGNGQNVRVQESDIRPSGSASASSAAFLPRSSMFSDDGELEDKSTRWRRAARNGLT